MSSKTSQSPVVLLTAASHGIGAGVARVLAARGYRVALLARSEAVLEFAAELGGIGVQGTVEREADLQRLVTAAMESYGRINAVVNNTGHPAKGDLLALNDQDWQNGYDLILGSVIRMARLTTPLLRAQGGGAIVNLSSYAAFSPEKQWTWEELYAYYAGECGIEARPIVLTPEEYAGHRGPYRCGIKNVSFDDLEPRKRFRSESFRTPRQAAHCVARVQELFQQLPAHISRGASNQNQGLHFAHSFCSSNNASICRRR